MKQINTVNPADNARDTVQTRHVFINGQRITVSEDLWKLYQKEINDSRNRARAEHSCACANYHECRGDCAMCSHHVQGVILSTDDERYGAGFSTGVNSPVRLVPSAEEEFIARDSLARVMRDAARIVKDGDEILRRKAMGYTERQIASDLDMDNSTVHKRLVKILAYLNENRSSYIDW